MWGRCVSSPTVREGRRTPRQPLLTRGLLTRGCIVLTLFTEPRPDFGGIGCGGQGGGQSCQVKAVELQLDDSTADRNGNRLCTISRAQLFHDVFDVNFDSLF